MGSYTLQANKSAICRYLDQSANDHTSADFTPDIGSGGLNDELLVGFAELPSANKYEAISSIVFYLYSPQNRIYAKEHVVHVLDSSFDEISVTYATIPRISEKINYITWISFPANSSSGWFNGSPYKPETLQKAIKGLKTGFSFVGNVGNGASSLIVKTSHSDYIPYVVINTTGTNITTSLNNISPMSGSVYKSLANTFSWAIVKSAPCYKDVIDQISGTFKWRADASSTIHTLPCGTAKSIVVPANTFTTDSIQWCVEAVDEMGTALTSEWYTLSTVEPIPTVSLSAPKDTIFDGTVENLFRWSYNISSGTPQYAFELQKSTDNSTWEALVAKTVSTDNFVSVPAGSFTSGTAYWRVKVYNNDDVASEWSSSAQITVVAAPDTPAVSIVSQEPRFGIRWTNSGQQGYEIALDGATVLKRFGTANNYTYSEWLADSEHTVSVRIQNSYGLWSDWGTAALNITNTAGDAITLTASGGSLFWATEGAYDKYIVYRDGKKIAETVAKSYVDNFACGTVSYKVRGVYTASGNYGISPVVSSTITYKTVTLYDTALSQRIELPASIVQTRAIGRTAKKDITFTHYSGSEKPVAEAGRAVDRTYKFECAFKASDAESRAQFEAMLGHTVFVADQYSNHMFGVMSTVSATQTEFYTAYDVTIEEVDYDA